MPCIGHTLTKTGGGPLSKGQSTVQVITGDQEGLSSEEAKDHLCGEKWGWNSFLFKV